MGGGGSAALRIASDWQIIVDVNGCKLLGLKPNLTGDSLSYMTGPRWTPQTSSRWTPHAQVSGWWNQTYARNRPTLNCGGGAGGSQTDRQPEQTAHEIYAALRNQRISPSPPESVWTTSSIMRSRFEWRAWTIAGPGRMI